MTIPLASLVAAASAAVAVVVYVVRSRAAADRLAAEVEELALLSRRAQAERQKFAEQLAVETHRSLALEEGIAKLETRLETLIDKTQQVSQSVAVLLARSRPG